MSTNSREKATEGKSIDRSPCLSDSVHFAYFPAPDAAARFPRNALPDFHPCARYRSQGLYRSRRARRRGSGRDVSFATIVIARIAVSAVAAVRTLFMRRCRMSRDRVTLTTSGVHLSHCVRARRSASKVTGTRRCNCAASNVERNAAKRLFVLLGRAGKKVSRRPDVSVKYEAEICRS